MNINCITSGLVEKLNFGAVNFSKRNAVRPILLERQYASDCFTKSVTDKFETETQPDKLYLMIKTLIEALNDKNPYTCNHSKRVGLYGLLFAKTLDIPDDRLEEVETAAILHDIGKILVPNNIICKEGKLNFEEYDIIKSHSLGSKTLLQNHPEFNEILYAVKHHHERWDGKGYPDGLQEEDIPYLSRIIAIVDSYDAMTSARPYRDGLPHEQAITEIERYSGAQFDPELAKRFLEAQNLIRDAKNHPNTYFEEHSILYNKIK